MNHLFIWLLTYLLGLKVVQSLNIESKITEISLSHTHCVLICYCGLLPPGCYNLQIPRINTEDLITGSSAVGIVLPAHDHLNQE